VADDVRERILQGAFACVARYGLAKTTVEDAARAAGLSRATVYRYFPGGREQLVREVISWEAGRFFARLAGAVAGAPDLPALLEEALVFAHEAVESHEVLQKVLQTEPEVLLGQLTVDADRIVGLVKVFLLPSFQAVALPAGASAQTVADYVARMVLSLIESPGRWDLTDRDQVRDLVRTELLAPLSQV